MDDDREFYSLTAILALLAVIGILQSKIIRRHEETIADLRCDVEFLKDHTIARETEARP
jgi:hypothetical protein